MRTVVQQRMLQQRLPGLALEAGVGLNTAQPCSDVRAGCSHSAVCLAATLARTDAPHMPSLPPADECNITASELNRNMQVLYRFLSEFTGLPTEQVEMECGECGCCSTQGGSPAAGS